MNKKIHIIIYIALTFPFWGWGQGSPNGGDEGGDRGYTYYDKVIKQKTIPKPNFFDPTLPIPNTNYDAYIARDTIRLLPGFNSSHIKGKEFLGRINDTMIFPVEYQEPIDPNRPIDETKEVGAIAGVVDVSPTGAATYQIPIFTPPGTAGMQPQISIVYNSQAGNGLLGVGWDIAGLSAITRTGQTVYHDGIETFVSLNNTDRFLLDGSRLIVTNNGAYGANGTVYATEQETYSRITSMEAIGSGPKWFKVITKNGMTIEYGNSPNSRVLLGSTVWQWRINKITDDNGNYMLYTYANNGDGELRIEKMEYTGTASGQAPFCTVTFLYSSERKDAWREYITNQSAFHEHLVRSIKIESNGEIVRRYWFYYTYDDFASYLVEIIEEGSDGKQFNSTIINRQKDNFLNNTKKFETENSNEKKPKQIYVADITGNGKKDIFITHTFDKKSDPTYEFFYSNSSDNIEHFPSGPVKAFSIYFIVDTEMFGTYINHNTFPDKKYRGEYISSPDRDGKQHVFFILCNLYEKPNDTTWTHYFYECVFKNTKFGDDFYWINKIEYTCNKKYDVRLFSGDFHGDGSVPYFLMRTQVLDDNGNELENQPYYVIPGYTRGLPESQLITNLNGAKDILIYDMNGDEKSSLIKLDSNNTSSTFYSFDKNNNGTYNMKVLYSYDNLLNSKSLIGDFNGDGKTDILRKASSSYNLSINTGNGFVTVFTDIPFQQGDSAIYVGDFNGDGRSDVFIPTHNAIYLNKGYKSFQGTYPYTFPIDLKGIYHFKKHTVPELAYHADSSYQFLIVDFNGDGKESIVYSNSNYGRLAMYSLSPKVYSPLVNNITDGLNNTVRFEYDAIFHGLIHERGKEPKYNDVTFSKMNLLAVSKLISKNGIGSNNTISFYYKGARAHTPSRRFMGFNSITSTDITKNIKCTNIFGYDNSCFNVYLDTTYLHLASNNTLAYSIIYKNTTHTFGNNRFFQYVYSTSKKYYPTNDAVNEGFEYDVANGNLIKHTLYSPLKTIDSITYIKKGKSEFKNKISRHDIIRSHNDDPGKKHTRYIIYDYDNKGNLVKTTSDLNVITDYIISPIGLVTQQKISAPQEETFIEDYFYDEKNRFITKSTITGLGSSDYRYNNSGNLLSQTDVNKLTTKYRYDGFGRMNGVRFPEGYTSLSTYNWVSGNSDKLRFNIETVTQGGPTVKTFYDILGREVQTQTDGFNGTVVVDTEYNNKGQLFKTSYPYYTNGVQKWVQNDYDDYGRIETITDNGLITKYSYTPGTNISTIKTPDGKTTSRYIDVLGNLRWFEDEGGKVDYKYHCSGQPKTITVGNDVVFKMTYDKFGRQDTLKDPNAGTIVYGYTPFNEMNYMKDMRGKVTTAKYDFLRRLKNETSPDDNITYKYHTSGQNIGMLEYITGNNQKKVAYEYDNYGRETKVTEYALTTQYEYNQYGQKTAVTYPAGFKIKRTYNNKGYLTEIKNAANDQLIWKRNEETALGQPKQYTIGNGKTITFDYDNYHYLTSIITPDVQHSIYSFNPKNGNLNKRDEKVFSANKFNNEAFGYDKLNRLDSINLISIQGTLPKVITKYLDNGNIDKKSDVGQYVYESNKPHAVKQITTPSNVLFNSGEQTAEYNSYQKVYYIEGQNGYKMNIHYGVGKERIKTELLYQNSLQKTKFFATNYEKEVTPKTTRDVNYISTPYGTVAAYIQENNSAQMYYLHKDHLGSITHITNASGTVVERRSFDAWGRPRHPDNWTYNNVPAMTILDRGYTGHEHLFGFDLINMNGRMYDPLINRFLSPDPYVQNVGSQGFNRYSYCINNPLKYIDPTGEAYYSNSSGEKFYQNRNDPVIYIDGLRYENVGSWCTTFTSGGGGSGLYSLFYENNLISTVLVEGASTPSFDIWDWDFGPSGNSGSPEGNPYGPEAIGNGYGNPSNNRGGVGGSGGAIGVGVGTNNNGWKSMTRQQQSDWFNSQVRKGGEAFFSHPAGMAFGGIMLAGVMAGVTTGIPAVVAELTTLFRVAQKVENSYGQAVAEAKIAYPNLAAKPNQNHHITPQYLGGDRSGPTAPLNPAYHQQITNAFRNEWGYGQGPIRNEIYRRQIMSRVYDKYPLPPGYSYP